MVFDTDNIELDKRMLKLADSDEIVLPDIGPELRRGKTPSSIEISIGDEKIILGLRKADRPTGDHINYVEYNRVLQIGFGMVEELEITVKYGAPFKKPKISRGYTFTLGRVDEVDFR
jgi:hypothetical protein